MNSKSKKSQGKDESDIELPFSALKVKKEKTEPNTGSKSKLIHFLNSKEKSK